MVKVEVFSSAGCEKCAAAENALQRLAESLTQGRLAWRHLDVLDELDYAVELGVISLPAIAINGRLAFSSLPSPTEFETALRKVLGHPAQPRGPSGR